MRAFIALEVPGHFADELAGLARQLENGLRGRFSSREGHHITLAFLGDIGEAGSRDAIAALEEACDDLDPPHLVASGLGAFGRPFDATLWLGLADDPALEKMAIRIHEHLRARKLSLEERRFRAHITLARHVRLPRSRLEGLVFPEPATATRVTLFKSTFSLGKTGYKPLHRIEVDASERLSRA